MCANRSTFGYEAQIDCSRALAAIEIMRTAAKKARLARS
jgi:hypothetical protein